MGDLVNDFLARVAKAFTTMLLVLAMPLSLVATGEIRHEGVALGRNASIAPSHGLGPTDPAELEAFLDALFARDIEETHIAGAAVSVVKDGKLLLAKGYGYADLEAGIPVDPEQTVFRIGSTTKLFTWTAVMQLVEQGKLDLDVDVESYLDFRIPGTYPQPITLRHLLTHTAGFEDLYLDFVTLEIEDRRPPGEWLASHLPARVRPPGEIAAYSNFGAALAGYVVARVSGQSYDEYIQGHILDPLGMAHSTALGAVHPEVAARESVGYMYNDGAFRVFPKFSGPWDGAPMGFMGATATDMARFMIAHLQNGRYSDAAIRDARILRESTARQMHSTLFTHDPRLLGTAYGFFNFSDNGQRTIGHNGTAEPMHSLLLLLPDENVGVFVAYNTLGAGLLTVQHLGFQRAFFDHYYPAPALAPVQPPAGFAQQAGRFVGSYRMTRSAYTTLEKFIGFTGAVDVQITDPGDGTLALETPWGVWQFVEVEPLYFRQVNAPFHMVFREDPGGGITHLFTDYTPQFGFEKVDWYETPGFNVLLLLGCVLVFLSAIVIALIRAIRNRLSREQKPAPRGARLAWWIVLGISGVNLLFVVGSFLWNNPRPAFGIPVIFQIVLGLGVLSAVLAAVALISTVLVWRNSYWGVVARAYYSLVTVAAVAFVWFLDYWNLLGWRF
jgi:CubicO group peptidase (beta-lactamase class C family)